MAEGPVGTGGNVVVALVATRAPWGTAVRSFLRDHARGVTLEVPADRPSLGEVLSRADVLVLDDVMRTVTVADVARAHEMGAHVVGVADRHGGMGARYLEHLGVDEVLSSSCPPGDLVATFLRAGKRAASASGGPEWPRLPGLAAPAGTGRPLSSLSAWTKVSGGAGLSEMVVVAAQELSRTMRVLVIEADDATPVMVSRLMRSGEGGLPWALSRAAQGLGALPEGLSGARGDGTRPLGAFDAVCMPPGTPLGVHAQHLEKLLREAAERYDHVLVELGPLGGGAAANRSRAGARALCMASSVVVVAQPDPEGAARLVNWRAAYVGEGGSSPCHAVFGRARRSGYEREHLAGILSSNTGAHPFASCRFLPEDPAVARARWNAALTGRGTWLAAAQVLAHDVVGSAGRATGRARSRAWAQRGAPAVAP